MVEEEMITCNIVVIHSVFWLFPWMSIKTFLMYLEICLFWEKGILIDSNIPKAVPRHLMEIKEAFVKIKV